MVENAENAPAGARCTAPVFQKIVACFVKPWLHSSCFLVRGVAMSSVRLDIANLCKELMGIAHADWSWTKYMAIQYRLFQKSLWICPSIWPDPALTFFMLSSTVCSCVSMSIRQQLDRSEESCFLLWSYLQLRDFPATHQGRFNNFCLTTGLNKPRTFLSNGWILRPGAYLPIPNF